MAEMTVEEVGSDFASLGLDPRLVGALSELGYEEPTPIQRQAIPPLLQGRDLIGQAATGTGKTAAFALPLLQRIAEAGPDRPRPSALVLVPTRELAMQVSEAIHRYGRPLRAEVVPIYGGQAYGQQLRALRRGVDVVVATPGRALDHMRRGTLALGSVLAVVLDEADEMLDMGFAEDIEALLTETPATRQTMLFSATLPSRILGIAGRHLRDPIKAQVAAEPVPEGEAPRVRQVGYIVGRPHKPAALARVLEVEAPTAALVFCRTRNEVDELAGTLASRGYRPESLHGGMSQEQRDRVMRQFRAGAADLIIATDVAARGLDVGHLTHVINYHVPCAAETYVHRIGRVGRAGREGVAITLAEPREHRMLRSIERTTGRRIDVGRLPTVADLRARRLELTRASLREALVEGGLDEYRVVVESLAGEFDIVDIALAAIKLAHRAGGDGEEEEIPEAGRPAGREPVAQGGGPGRRRADARNRGPAQGMTRVFINAGRSSGVGPRDVVGAIANSAGLPGRDIGSIDIADRFTLVEVPEDVAEYVIDSLDGARIKGVRVQARRDRRDGGRE